MATVNQINFIGKNKTEIKEPVLIVGSKQYEYDKENIKLRMQEWGFKDLTGIDLFEGEGVDHAIDITDTSSEFINNHRNFYNTIICMEVLTNVKNPFKASDNIISMLKNDGIVILSECYVRKISKMPVDLWRFTYDGTKELFSGLVFDDTKAMISFTREKEDKLIPLQYPLPQILSEKHSDESGLGYLFRRIHRKYLSKGVFRLSRLLPEITIYSIAKNNKK
ncbi:MAG: class I SAM-dependent methyltransferase [Ignavibacteria bacterium]|nr:class I SAM-dependent methyltransferase [Ignavibacteria bacterium]